MTIRVWHLDESSFDLSGGVFPPRFLEAKMGFRDNGSQEIACAELFAEGRYKLVASVQGDDIDKAWSLTNHIESSWNIDPSPEVLPEQGPQRSSSVGDLFEASDGRWSVCASIGFRDMPDLRSRAPAQPKSKRKMSKP